MDTAVKPDAACEQKMPKMWRLSLSMNAARVRPVPIHATMLNSIHNSAHHGFALRIAWIIASGRNCVKITAMATMVRVRAMNDRRLNRESVTVSNGSSASSDSRVFNLSRKAPSRCLSQPGIARVAAGTAAFCTNGAMSINVASPHMSRAAAMERSTPIEAHSRASSWTLSRAMFAALLAQSPFCHPAMTGVAPSSNAMVDGVILR